MKRTAVVSMLAVALLLASVVPSDAWRRGPSRGHWRGHSHVVIGVSPFWWGPPYPYWGYRRPYYVYPPPTVVVQEPPVYVQQQPPPAAPPAPPAYWYYCPSAAAYYPSVPACPEPWVKVPPRQP